MSEKTNQQFSVSAQETDSRPESHAAQRPVLPLPNYTLSTVCPACDAEMFRLACKVRCKRCGFMWDCSEV
jgi:hypothetical protein